MQEAPIALSPLMRCTDSCKIVLVRRGRKVIAKGHLVNSVNFV